MASELEETSSYRAEILRLRVTFRDSDSLTFLVPESQWGCDTWKIAQLANGILFFWGFLYFLVLRMIIGLCCTIYFSALYCCC